MSEGKISIRKAIPIIVLTWILSLVTTLAIVYFTPLVPIGTSQIGDSAVTSGKIANAAIITTKLADGSITNAKILDGTIIGEDIADGSIVTLKVADGAITQTKIADDSVTTTKLADSAVVTVKLADDSVTSSKIMDNAIVTVKLANGAVTTAKILDGTITAADLADGTVTSVKIADGAITTAKIANYAVTSLKLAPDSVPFAYTSSTTATSTTSTTFIDMLDTSVTISLDRASHLLIIFTSEVAFNPAGPSVYFQARVGTSTALPDSYGYQLTPATTYYDAYTCSFYSPSVAAGSHSVKIRWHVSSGTGYALYRALTVIALPA